MRIYLVGALKNPAIPLLANTLRGEGVDVVDDWYSAGELADTCWREHEQLRGRTYSEALKGEHARNVFEFDRRLIDSSDIVVLVLPAGRSAWAEMGYASGSGKRVVALLDTPNPDRWDVMLQFAHHRFDSVDELTSYIRGMEQSQDPQERGWRRLMLYGEWPSERIARPENE